MATKETAVITVRVNIPDLRTQKIITIDFGESVWSAQQAILEMVGKDLPKESSNYGVYLPATVVGKNGKFLDETRSLGEYHLPGKAPQLEFLYKKRDYSQMEGSVSTKSIAKANSKANLKKFVDTVQSGSVKKLKKMLSTTIDPNYILEDGNTPLGIACGRQSHIECILPLLSGGAHIDFRGKDGLTAMHRAAIGGNTAAVKMLLSLGASPNYLDAKGLTPLYHTAIMGDDISCCHALLKHRSDIGVKDQSGWNELHQAAKYGHAHIIEILILYGCPINDQNHVGNTPLHVAAAHGQSRCALLLMTRGANRHTLNHANQPPNQLAILCGHHQLAKQITDFSDSEIEISSAQPEYNPMARSKKFYTSKPSASSHSANQSGGATTSTSQGKERKLPSSAGNAATFPRKPSNGSVSSNQAVSRTPSASSSSSPKQAKLTDRSASQSSSNSSQDREKKVSNSPHFFPRKPSSSAFKGKEVDTNNSSQHSTGEYESSSKKQTPVHRYSSNRAGNSANQQSPSPMRERWYPCAGGKSYMAVKNIRPQRAGDITLKKGQNVEVLFMGKGGYCEGKTGEEQGWFPYNAIQEVTQAMKTLADDQFPDEYEEPPVKKTETVAVKYPESTVVGIQNTAVDSAGSIAERDTKINEASPSPDNKPRKSNIRNVEIRRGNRGFGFAMRGVKSVNGGQFKPTPHVPSLQCIGQVEPGSPADEAGLKQGDFIIEVNGQNTTYSTHEEVVAIIKRPSVVLKMRVITPLVRPKPSPAKPSIPPATQPQEQKQPLKQVMSNGGPDAATTHDQETVIGMSPTLPRTSSGSGWTSSQEDEDTPTTPQSYKSSVISSSTKSWGIKSQAIAKPAQVKPTPVVEKPAQVKPTPVVEKPAQVKPSTSTVSSAKLVATAQQSEEEDDSIVAQESGFAGEIGKAWLERKRRMSQKSSGLMPHKTVNQSTNNDGTSTCGTTPATHSSSHSSTRGTTPATHSSSNTSTTVDQKQMHEDDKSLKEPLQENEEEHLSEFAKALRRGKEKISQHSPKPSFHSDLHSRSNLESKPSPPLDSKAGHQANLLSKPSQPDSQADSQTETQSEAKSKSETQLKSEYEAQSEPQSEVKIAEYEFESGVSPSTSSLTTVTTCTLSSSSTSMYSSSLASSFADIPSSAPFISHSSPQIDEEAAQLTPKQSESKPPLKPKPTSLSKLQPQREDSNVPKLQPQSEDSNVSITKGKGVSNLAKKFESLAREQAQPKLRQMPPKPGVHMIAQKIVEDKKKSESDIAANKNSITMKDDHLQIIPTSGYYADMFKPSTIDLSEYMKPANNTSANDPSPQEQRNMAPAQPEPTASTDADSQPQDTALENKEDKRQMALPQENEEDEEMVLPPPLLEDFSDEVLPPPVTSSVENMTETSWEDGALPPPPPPSSVPPPLQEEDDNMDDNALPPPLQEEDDNMDDNALPPPLQEVDGNMDDNALPPPPPFPMNDDDDDPPLIPDLPLSYPPPPSLPEDSDPYLVPPSISSYPPPPPPPLEYEMEQQPSYSSLPSSYPSPPPPPLLDDSDLYVVTSSSSSYLPPPSEDFDSIFKSPPDNAPPSSSLSDYEHDGDSDNSQCGGFDLPPPNDAVFDDHESEDENDFELPPPQFLDDEDLLCTYSKESIKLPPPQFMIEDEVPYSNSKESVSLSPPQIFDEEVPSGDSKESVSLPPPQLFDEEVHRSDSGENVYLPSQLNHLSAPAIKEKSQLKNFALSSLPPPLPSLAPPSSLPPPLPSLAPPSSLPPPLPSLAPPSSLPPPPPSLAPPDNIGGGDLLDDIVDQLKLLTSATEDNDGYLSDSSLASPPPPPPSCPPPTDEDEEPPGLLDMGEMLREASFVTAKDSWGSNFEDNDDDLPLPPLPNSPAPPAPSSLPPVLPTSPPPSSLPPALPTSPPSSLPPALPTSPPPSPPALPSSPPPSPPVASSRTPSRTPSPPGSPSICHNCGYEQKEDNGELQQTYLNTPVNQWTTGNVCQWLIDIGLGSYSHIFAENEVSGEHLIDLTREDLKDLGLSKIGHMKTFKKKLEQALLK